MGASVDRENLPPSTPPATEFYLLSPPGLEELCESPSPPGCNPLPLGGLLLQTPPHRRIESSETSPMPTPYTPVRPAPGLDNVPTPTKVPKSGALGERKAWNDGVVQDKDHLLRTPDGKMISSFADEDKPVPGNSLEPQTGAHGHGASENGFRYGQARIRGNGCKAIHCRRGRGCKGKGKGKTKGRLPLTDLVPEPCNEQKLFLMQHSIAHMQQMLQMAQAEAMQTYQVVLQEHSASGTSPAVSAVPALPVATMPTMPTVQEDFRDEKFTETESGDWILEFKVRKATASTDLGMQVSYLHGRPPVKVQKVHDTGVIPSWNRLCLGDFEHRAVCPGDQILAVNEVYDVQPMLLEMKEKSLLTLKILRPFGWRPRTGTAN